ncbi:MAG: glycosyltransferase family 2 protein [Rubrobacteraceae bacterium]
MKFSAVIVTYDSWAYAVRCIESLYRTGYTDFEVVVIDNGREEPPELSKSVRVIRNAENVGFARACNQGISASHGDCVILINPDTLVEPNFFTVLEKFFRENLRAGIAGPRVVDSFGNLQLSARREVSFLSGLLGRTSFLTRIFLNSVAVKSMFPAMSELSGPTKVDWVSGACMAVRRTALDRIGGLDERFFMYFEDADLCRRSREAGQPVYYLPRMEVLHLTGASSRSRVSATWRLHKSAFLYHRKHGPHGPLNLYSGLVLLGLAARATVKLAISAVERIG